MFSVFIAQAPGLWLKIVGLAVGKHLSFWTSCQPPLPLPSLACKEDHSKHRGSASQDLLQAILLCPSLSLALGLSLSLCLCLSPSLTLSLSLSLCDPNAISPFVACSVFVYVFDSFNHFVAPALPAMILRIATLGS